MSRSHGARAMACLGFRRVPCDHELFLKSLRERFTTKNVFDAALD
jgi:hypothetical protein